LGGGAQEAPSRSVTPRLVLRPQAEAELLDARDWYEDQRSGLGEAFAAEVDTVFARIVEAPLSYPRVHGDTRRAFVRRFPYAVYFHTRPDEIVVLAVMHGRRHPRRWQSRR
jgi:toxin ParE1/3/4